MNKNWISRVCLALALLLTVYHFFIIQTPVENQVTGMILVLLIAANIPVILKSK